MIGLSVNELVKAMTVHIIRFLMGYVYSVFAAFTFNLCKSKSINYTFWIIPDKRSGYLYRCGVCVCVYVTLTE